MRYLAIPAALVLGAFGCSSEGGQSPFDLPNTGGDAALADANGHSDSGAAGGDAAVEAASGSTSGGSVGAASPDAATGARGSGGADFNESGTCSAHTLQTERVAPHLLIVLDRSASMSTNDSNTDRWKGSVDAVNAVVGELEDRIRFGLMTFPHAGSNGSGAANVCTPGKLDEPMQLGNASPIGEALANLVVGGGTPTAQTLGVASGILAGVSAEGGPSEFAMAEKYVMLVTDGDPNCFTYSDDPDPEAQKASVEAVEALTDAGVTTYVIGFQTAATSFAHVLDDMAMVGGTGDLEHRSVASGDELLAELREIAGAAVSCSFVLPSKVREDRVEVSVDGKDASYGSDWDLLDDGYTIELRDGACNALRTGAVVEARVLCDPVRLL